MYNILSSQMFPNEMLTPGTLIKTLRLQGMMNG